MGITLNCSNSDRPRHNVKQLIPVVLSIWECVLFLDLTLNCSLPSTFSVRVSAYINYHYKIDRRNL